MFNTLYRIWLFNTLYRIWFKLTMLVLLWDMPLAVSSTLTTRSETYA